MATERVLRRVWQDDPEGYFAGQTITQGLARTFFGALGELRDAGVEAADLDGAVDINPAKKRMLAALLQAYAAALDEEKCYDTAVLFAEGAQGAGPARDTVYAVLDETRLSRQALRFVEAVAGAALVRLGRADYGISAPAASAAARFSATPPPDAPGRLGAAGGLLGGGLSPRAFDEEGRVRLWQALGPENEVGGVVREILARKIPLDTVEIAYTAEHPYFYLLHDAARRFGLPIAFAGGFPASLSRPGQALALFLRWVGSRFEMEELVKLCRGRLIEFGRALGADQAPPPYRVAMWLERGGGGSGRARYDELFSRAEQDLQRVDASSDAASEEEAEEERASLAAARRAAEALLGRVPEGGDTPLADMAAAACGFLADFAVVRDEQDQKTLDGLTERLQRIAGRVSLRAAAPRLAQLLADLTAGHKAHPSVALPGQVYAAPLAGAGYTDRRHLYVLGLDESAFPGGTGENPILLDDERRLLTPDLDLYRRRPGEKVWQLVRLLGAAGGRVTLVASRLQLTDGRETYPAALFQQAADLLGGGRDLEEVVETVYPLVGPEGFAAADTEAVMACRRAASFAEAVDAAFPQLRQGAAARRARAGYALSRYDGLLGRETPQYDPAAGGVVSASQLETLAGCPYRYFLRYVLRLRPSEGFAEDPSRWLNPLDFGSLLHDLFCDFMRQLQEEGRRPDPELHAGALRERLERQVRVWRERVPPPNEAAYRADVKRLEQAAQVFLASESRRPGVEPLGFEVSFGFGEGDGLNRAAPVAVDLGGGRRFRIRGRIDRVDRVAEGLEIWDYKTGSSARYDEADLIKRGTNLQWALYAYALEAMTRGRSGAVERSGYFFISERENGRRIGGRPPAPAELGQLLRPLFSMAAEGCFFHVQKEDNCRYCEFRRVCAAEQRLRRDMGAINEAMADQPRVMELLNGWMNA